MDINNNKKIDDNFLILIRKYYYKIVIVMLIVLIMYGKNILNGVCIDKFLKFINLYDNKSLIYDMIKSSIIWSFTYLMCRRLYNPETRTIALEKYSVDAFYGSLSVILNTYINFLIQ